MQDEARERAEALEVTQADREAAAPMVIVPANSRKIRNGEMDWSPVVQAFARHRRASSPAPLIDEAMVGDVEERALAPDVIRLVIAARDMAFGDGTEEDRRALDQASEAFADRVPWEDEPSDEEVARREAADGRA